MLRLFILFAVVIAHRKIGALNLDHVGKCRPFRTRARRVRRAGHGQSICRLRDRDRDGGLRFQFFETATPSRARATVSTESAGQPVAVTVAKLLGRASCQVSGGPSPEMVGVWSMIQIRSAYDGP